jgi:hypothetical protein
MDVFVSRPAWVAPEYKRGLDGFLRVLAAMGLTPRTLGTTDYPSRAPLDEVIALLDECAGAVILGYPQLRIATGFVKDRAITEELLLPTEWNHIEAGLAYARGLPLLVVHQEGLRRGIFDRGATPTFLYERDLRQADWSVAADMQGALKKWKEDCLKPPDSAKFVDNAGPPGVPVCPNCSTRGRPVYMSPLLSDFIAIENATHECTQCHFKRPR